MSAKKATEIVPIMLRIRESLRRKIEHAAKKKARSLNAEMAERLEYTFANEDMDQIEKNIFEERMQFVESRFLELGQREAEFDANARDAKLLRRMVGDNDSSLRVLMKLGANPDWSKSATSRQQLADEILPLILNPKTIGGGTQ